ncbi:hypothetical protein B0H17DRAFT_1151537 [Mycena rosella]|uniref:Uncharacterized protein n=1 Tax=Mycena rosella TaxID=1033263 RepID=A0AAD7FGH1_MYCRO|nr:hypothetical protein B0H17DRAFT_1151537 [Mycena rosella]
MPPTSKDLSTTQTTAPWSGLNPPPVPLCYSYLDSTIPHRALQAFRGYLTHNDLWERRTPDTASTSWQQLRRLYQGLPIMQESWLGNVLTLLNLIVEALLEDLGLAKALLAYEPHLQFSQHGDKDWLTTAEDYPDVIEKLIEVMNDAGGPERRPLGLPISRPMVGGGCEKSDIPWVSNSQEWPQIAVGFNGRHLRLYSVSRPICHHPCALEWWNGRVADRLPHVTAQKERLWACTMRVENLAQQFCVNVSEDRSQILWGISVGKWRTRPQIDVGRQYHQFLIILELVFQFPTIAQALIERVGLNNADNNIRPEFLFRIEKRWKSSQ